MPGQSIELPKSGFALEIDGRLKTEFSTKEGAEHGAIELKRRFPMLQIRIYDAAAQSRHDLSDRTHLVIDCQMRNQVRIQSRSLSCRPRSPLSVASDRFPIRIRTGVCTENLSSGVVVMKSAQDGK